MKDPKVVRLLMAATAFGIRGVIRLKGPGQPFLFQS
jgi:hypothetical protein